MPTNTYANIKDPKPKPKPKMKLSQIFYKIKDKIKRHSNN